MRRALACVLAWAGLALAAGAEDDGPRTGPGGFSLAGATVPPEQIVAGGPPRDGIPSVDDPEFVPLARASWVAPGNPVLGVARGDEAKVYPVHLIERHQVVNDVVGGLPVAVTYDPLAGSPLAFERKVGERVLEFGVAGLLYNSNFLLYDRETESLWSQLRGEAVAGPLAGTRLRRVPVRQETLALWLERHPDPLVLARPAPEIDYRYSPFSAYWISERIPSRVDAWDARFHPKEVVVGVVVEGRARAYLGSRVTAAGGRVRDRFQGRALELEYWSGDAVFRWDVPDDVEVTEAYWFAWKAFHPDTEVWNEGGAGQAPEPE